MRSSFLSKTDSETQVEVLSNRRIVEERSLIAKTLAVSIETEERLDFARSVVCSVISAYWDELYAETHRNWSICELPSAIRLVSLRKKTIELAQSIGRFAARLDVLDASYAIGVLYTGMVPTGFRSRLGAYYTPPSLCERLLDMATEAGVDWSSARVLDPACGGGAFLSPIARRMADSLEGSSPKHVLNDIQWRLRGFELDPFAAWMSRVFLDVTLGKACREAGTRPTSVVRVCNSLEQNPDGEGFGLVVGNPPYGRVTLSPKLREKYRDSLFGHANLYGVFTDLALRFTRSGGVLAYVTPTSFLTGEYFKELRKLIGREAPPVSVDFIGPRRGVFADVLQETLLAVYKRGGDPEEGRLHFISMAPDGSIEAISTGGFVLPNELDRPWLMPRRKSQCTLARFVVELPYRLANYGYTVSTGPLVWNRHKTSLRDQPGKGRYPLIWAESVRPEGVFEFRSSHRNHRPYFEPKQHESWVITKSPCILLKRTTAKEQHRRLFAAELPASFIDQHGAVVIENHLNMIKPRNGQPRVSSSALAALLNSGVADQVFRCINGSVAVSAYELEALPLPRPEDMEEIEQLIGHGATNEMLEDAVERLYISGDM